MLAKNGDVEAVLRKLLAVREVIHEDDDVGLGDADARRRRIGARRDNPALKCFNRSVGGEVLGVVLTVGGLAHDIEDDEGLVVVGVEDVAVLGDAVEEGSTVGDEELAHPGLAHAAGLVNVEEDLARVRLGVDAGKEAELPIAQSVVVLGLRSKEMRVADVLKSAMVLDVGTRMVLKGALQGLGGTEGLDCIFNVGALALGRDRTKLTEGMTSFFRAVRTVLLRRAVGLLEVSRLIAQVILDRAHANRVAIVDVSLEMRRASARSHFLLVAQVDLVRGTVLGEVAVVIVVDGEEPGTGADRRHGTEVGWHRSGEG